MKKSKKPSNEPIHDEKNDKNITKERSILDKLFVGNQFKIDI